ncbi:MAG: sulfotransferase [Anaerolineae bacterium]|nr:sulfotransferase [Anaerolineae bacterium]
MTYSFRRVLYITYLAFFKAKNTLARLTPKRLFVLVVFYTIYIVVEIITWLSFGLDEIFFRGYHRQEVKQPVFIVGNPRSGTTFLHRLLARDEKNFSSIHLWEILFAPSVTQRKVAWAVAALDRSLGGLLHRILHWFDRHFVSASNVMHKMSLVVPEEDEYFLIHQGATIIAGLFFGFPRATYPFVFFDTQLSRVEKRKIMRFYYHCLQRHLFAHRETRAILSKNPFFTPKVDALYTRFPSAKIIYLARNPLKVVPSYASLSAHWWRMFADPDKRYPHAEYILRATQHWYRYPVERLEQAPRESRVLVNFHELVADPEKVVTEIYEQLGLEISPEFAGILREASEKACEHTSNHEYSLEGVGFTKEQILSTYRDVYERWGFDPNII